MPVGSKVSHRVYVLRGSGRLYLPHLTTRVVESDFPPATMTIRFSGLHPFWDDETVDWAEEEVYVERFNIETGDLINVIGRGLADIPRGINFGKKEFEFTFTEGLGFSGARPITSALSGDYLVSNLMQALFIQADQASSGTYTVPGDYTLPGSRVFIRKGAYPSGPMSHPTFEAVVDWANLSGWLSEDLPTSYTTSGPFDIEDYLYADEFGAGYGAASGNPGPWDETAIEDPSLAQPLTVIDEYYFVDPDGTIGRYTEVDRAGDGAPSFVLPNMSRSVYIRPPGYVTRSVGSEGDLTIIQAMRQLVDEAGLKVRLINRTNPTPFYRFQQDYDDTALNGERAGQVSKLSTSTNLSDATLFPVPGGFSEVHLFGAVDAGGVRAYAKAVDAGATRIRPKKLSVRVPQEFIQEAADAVLAASNLTQPSVEVVVHPDVDTLHLGNVGDIPEMHQKFDVTIQSRDAAGVPTAHLANGTYAGLEVKRRVIECDLNGNETITLRLGDPKDDVAELLRNLGDVSTN